jgi:predicted Zn-ribbon and HTH transcriptional regulator
MIEPDVYIDEYYRLNREYLSKPAKNKYSNLNFSRLTTDRKIVQVVFDILINEKLQVKDRIDWDLVEENRSPEIFANKLVDKLEGIIDKNLIDYNKNNIKNQILDQLLDHIEKNTFFPRLRLIKKENEASQNTQLCMNCNTVIYNPEYCVNCMFVFEKKIDKQKTNVSILEEENRQTERQRMIELRQKNINVDDISVSYTQEAKEKKICKKCGEVNVVIATECKNCKFKFPLISYFDIHMNQNYSLHFWDKIYKNSIVQQLKNFGEFFTQEDFCSLKYLYNKIHHVLRSEFKEILTEEAYSDLLQNLAKTYFSFSNPTLTV